MSNINNIGSGATFPIILTKFKDGETGKVQQVPQVKAVEDADGNVTLTPLFNPDGSPKMVDAIAWNPFTGDPSLIVHNIQSLVGFQLGQKMRDEAFGTRLWEVIEEPNTQLQAFLVKEFLKRAINLWEGRIIFLDSKITRENEKLIIDLSYRVGDLYQQTSLVYNSQTNSYNVND